MTQLVEHETLGLQVVSSGPTMGVEIAKTKERKEEKINFSWYL